MNRKLLLWLLLIIWFPAGMQTVKAAERSSTQVRETRNFEEFSDAASRLAPIYETMGIKSRGSKGSFASGRLIVKADGNFQPGGCGALEAVKSPDHTYLLQYDKAEKAERMECIYEKIPQKINSNHTHSSYDNGHGCDRICRRKFGKIGEWNIHGKPEPVQKCGVYKRVNGK